MLHNNFEIRVLVKGRPINEYFHNGQTFIEGRDNSNFEIEFKNLTPGRVEVVLSVDGLSVIDGKEAGPASSGYLVNGHETLRIPGWKLTDEQVAAFVFAGKKKSYATQSTGSSRNNGVIGALVFAEKFVRPQPVYHQYHQFGGLLMPMAGGYVQPTFASGQPFNSVMRGMTGGTLGMNNISSTVSDSWAPDNMVLSSHTTAMASSAGPEVERKTSGGRIVRETVLENTALPVEQTLGTGFGEATEFATTTVSFNRGDLAAMVILYYDDSRGLRARGIELTRPSRQRLAKANAPQAFPGMNCAPPPGWKG